MQSHQFSTSTPSPNPSAFTMSKYDQSKTNSILPERKTTVTFVAGKQ
jgi:hypothetical protein